MKRGLAGVLLVMMVLAMMASSAFAGIKWPGPGGGSISATAEAP